eukprot:scaffold148743_cov28-Prasinocladus_malaysianus.AAC.1
MKFIRNFFPFLSRVGIRGKNKGRVIDEFKVCSRRKCADAPDIPGIEPVGPEPVPDESRTSPAAAQTTGPLPDPPVRVLPLSDSNTIQQQIAEALPEMNETPTTTLGSAPQDPSPSIGPHPQDNASPANEADGSEPAYLEKNEPVVEEASENCPFGIVKINLDSSDTINGTGKACSANTRDDDNNDSQNSTRTSTSSGSSSFRAPATPGGYSSVAELEAALLNASKKEKSDRLITVLLVMIPLGLAVLLILGTGIWLAAVCVRKSRDYARRSRGNSANFSQQAVATSQPTHQHQHRHNEGVLVAVASTSTSTNAAATSGCCAESTQTSSCGKGKAPEDSQSVQ